MAGLIARIPTDRQVSYSTATIATGAFLFAVGALLIGLSYSRNCTCQKIHPGYGAGLSAIGLPTMLAGCSWQKRALETLGQISPPDDGSPGISPEGGHRPNLFLRALQLQSAPEGSPNSQSAIAPSASQDSFMSTEGIQGEFPQSGHGLAHSHSQQSPNPGGANPSQRFETTVAAPLPASVGVVHIRRVEAADIFAAVRQKHTTSAEPLNTSDEPAPQSTPSQPSAAVPQPSAVAAEPAAVQPQPAAPSIIITAPPAAPRMTHAQKEAERQRLYNEIQDMRNESTRAESRMGCASRDAPTYSEPMPDDVSEDATLADLRSAHREHEDYLAGLWRFEADGAGSL
jgi:hypothetical protein